MCSSLNKKIFLLLFICEPIRVSEARTETVSTMARPHNRVCLCAVDVAYARYLGHVRGGDDPGAVGVVVVLDRVVGRGDGAAGASQLASTHGRCKTRCDQGVRRGLRRAIFGDTLWFCMNGTSRDFGELSTYGRMQTNNKKPKKTCFCNQDYLE